MVDENSIRAKYRKLFPVMTEWSRRIWAATEAESLGHGGVSAVARATGISRNTIPQGMKELELPEVLAPERVRRGWGGRKRASVFEATLKGDLERLIDPVTR